MGDSKKSYCKKSVENNIKSLIPTTYLQNHKNTTLVLDKECSSELTRFKTPWLVGPCDWSDVIKRKAIVWLCEITEKSILKLTDEDYNKNGLSDLLALEGSSYEFNIKMFNHFQNTISGWPGGKPDSDDSTRPERKNPNPKRVLIFSPHPDDDVISMGGTFDRLVSQGHEVHVAYQTSGNIAVSNSDVLRYLEVINSTFPDCECENDELIEMLKNSSDIINNSRIREIAATIREKESLAATRFIGIPDHQVHFLKLPFYETGTIKKNIPTVEDKKIISETIKKIKPHQIYAAGDLADPHGTHKVCLDALFIALEEMKSEKEFLKDCWVWLYRGAWHEWDSHEIEMAVPMSPDQVLRKRHAIFYHQSQKDGVMFQGDDHREFWVRAEERNADTAKKYKAMGLSDYEAMEAFKRYFY